MYRFVMLTGLITAALGAQGQSQTAYVNASNAVVMANPMDEEAKSLGQLRASDSVQVGTERLAGPQSMAAKWVFVRYPAYATVAAGAGWVLRRQLVGSRDSVTVARLLTKEEARQHALKTSYKAPASTPPQNTKPRAVDRYMHVNGTRNNKKAAH